MPTTINNEITNSGSQKVTFDFKEPAKGWSFNHLLRGVIAPGIYKGLELEIVSGNDLQITAGTIFINGQDITRASDDLAVKVETKSNVTFTASQITSSENDVVYVVYDYIEQIQDWATFHYESSTTFFSSRPLNSIVIGEIIYDGGGNVTGFSRISRDIGIINNDDILFLTGIGITDKILKKNVTLKESELSYAIGSLDITNVEFDITNGEVIILYNSLNVGSSAVVSDFPLWTETAIAPSARSVENRFAIASSLSDYLSPSSLSLSGSTLIFDIGIGAIGISNPIRVSTPSPTSGLLIQRSIISAISLTLTTSTKNQRICGINTTDGQATFSDKTTFQPNNGYAEGIEWFLYVIYDPDSNQDLIGISRSPLHKYVPTNYIHSMSASGFTGVNSYATAWDTMIISAEGALITPSNCGCVCLGSAFTTDVSGGSSNAGWFQNISINSGYVPKWDNKTSRIYSAVSTLGYSGYGSSDSTVMKFVSIFENTGDKCQFFDQGGTLASGGIGGNEFLLSASGFYSLVGHLGSPTGFWGGLTLNSLERSTNIESISTIATRLTMAGATPNGMNNSIGAKFYNAGDIIRIQTNAVAMASGCISRLTFLGFE